MAIAYVQSKQGVNGFGDPTITFDSDNTAGNFIVCGVNIYLLDTVVGVSDTRGNTYTLLLGPITGLGGISLTIYYAENIGAGANTVTADINANNGWNQLTCGEYSGVATSGSADKSASAVNDATVDWTSGNTATTTQNDELIIGFGGSQNNAPASWTAGTSFTIRQQQSASNAGSFLEDRIVSSTGAYAATATANASSSGIVGIATFKAAAAAAGNPWYAYQQM